MATTVRRVCSAALKEGTNAHTIIWRVKFIPKKSKIKSIVSPEFCVPFLDNVVWILGIILNDSQIHLYLHRVDNLSENAEIITIDFELSLLTLGDLPERVRVCRNHIFMQKDFYRFINFIDLDDCPLSSVYFPNNSLTVRCRILTPNIVINPTICVISTVFVKERLSFCWCIQQFLSMTEIPIYHGRFPTETLNNESFTLKISKESHTKDISHVKMSMDCINMFLLGRLKCKISTENTAGTLENEITADCPYDMWFKENSVWEIQYELKNAEITQRQDTLLHHGALIMRFEFEFWLPRPDEFEISVLQPTNTDFQMYISNDKSDSSGSSDSDSYSSSEHSDIDKKDSNEEGSSLNKKDYDVPESSLGNSGSDIEDSSHSNSDSDVEDSSLVKKESDVPESSLGNSGSDVENSSLSKSDSDVEDPSLVEKDHDVPESSLGNSGSDIEDSSFSMSDSDVEDSSLVKKDSALRDSAGGNSSLREDDLVKTVRLRRKRKLSLEL